jgi:septum formation protein
MVVRLAGEKAAAVAGTLDRPAWVLSADTTVLLDDMPVGKPDSPDDAVATLMALADRTHEVLSGVALLATHGAEEERTVVRSLVTMRPITVEEAESYVAGGEPLDRAGAYAIQGEGGRFVMHVEGSYTNVMGLPMEYVTVALAGRGIVPEHVA